jgi:hypothetical protein
MCMHEPGAAVQQQVAVQQQEAVQQQVAVQQVAHLQALLACTKGIWWRQPRPEEQVGLHAAQVVRAVR